MPALEIMPQCATLREIPSSSSRPLPSSTEEPMLGAITNSPPKDSTWAASKLEKAGKLRKKIKRQVHTMVRRRKNRSREVEQEAASTVAPSTEDELDEEPPQRETRTSFKLAYLPAIEEHEVAEAPESYLDL